MLPHHVFTIVDGSLYVRNEQEPDTNLYKSALEAIKDFIKTSTSSMTAVPKPLKFLRPHYDELTKLYEEWQGDVNKVLKFQDHFGAYTDLIVRIH